MGIYNDIDALNELYDSQVDEETGEIKEAEVLEALEQEVLSHGFERICKFLRNVEADAEALKVEKLRIAKKQTAMEKKAESIKRSIEFFFKKAGKDRIEAGSFTLSLRKTEKVKLEEDFNIAEYMRIKQEPDLTAIKKAIKEGKEINGASIEENQNIWIR